MKLKFNTQVDTNSITISLNKMLEDLDEATIIDIISQARLELIKKCAQELVNVNMQNIINQIDVKSLVNAVYIQSAKEISKQLTA